MSEKNDYCMANTGTWKEANIVQMSNLQKQIFVSEYYWSFM